MGAKYTYEDIPADIEWVKIEYESKWKKFWGPEYESIIKEEHYKMSVPIENIIICNGQIKYSNSNVTFRVIETYDALKAKILEAGE